MMQMVDLCAGTGAFTHAFESTGSVETVYANDFDTSSKTIYDANFNHHLTLGDLCKINIKSIPKHDILTCGIPCQPFSIAGKRKGFADDRTNVFWKILEIIKYHKPLCVVIENVKNMATHDNGATLKTITQALDGYYVKYNVLNTSDITGIPQGRERIYIVAVRKKITFNLDFLAKKKKHISKMLEPVVNDKYYYNDISNKIHQMILTSATNKNTVYQFRRKYVRENQSNECPTLTANMGTGGHNVPIILDDYGVRKLTPRECFNLQGFPYDYVLPPLSDSKLYKLAGNAVSVPVVKLIADRLVPELLKHIK
jgi:DNA (cytosine-5)-methyltransferase 1